MISNEMITRTKKLIKNSTLNNLRSCYTQYSKDYDARNEASGYESKISAIKHKTRNDKWVNDVYALRNTKLSERASKYFNMSNDLATLVKEADDIVAKGQAASFDDKVKRLASISDINSRLASAKKLEEEYKGLSPLAKTFVKKRDDLIDILSEAMVKLDLIKADCQKSAAMLDNEYSSYNKSGLTNNQIADARRFIKKFNSTSIDITKYCRTVDSNKIKSLEDALNVNQIVNDNIEKAAALDKKVASILPIKREKEYFDKVDSVLSEYNGTSADILKYCHADTDRTVRKAKTDLAREKEYLSCEKRIDMLGYSKERSDRWCDLAFSEYDAMKQNIKEYRNGNKLAQLYNDAQQFRNDIICEPYVKALLPATDFETVLALNDGLRSFAHRSLLDKHIPSFDSKWKNRVNKAKDDALVQAKKNVAEAERLMDNYEYTKAFNMCIEADKYGATYAAYLLGLLYYRGNGVVQSDTQAIRWLKKAAESKIVKAMSLLADIHMNISDDDAFYWRKLAVDNGSNEDKFDLAKMYYKGEGTAINYKTAYDMFTSLAKNGKQEANGYIGMMYEKGQYVTKDENLALSYYEKGKSVAWIAKKHKDLSDIFEERELDRQVSENYAKAKAGDPKAQFFIGVCYFKGYRTTQSYTMAKEWFEKAAEQGYIAAMNYLGDMYYNGLGVDKNEFTARRYYQKAKKV